MSHHFNGLTSDWMDERSWLVTDRCFDFEFVDGG